MNKKFSPNQILFHWVIFILVVLTYAAMELKGFAAKGSDIRELMMTLHYTFGVSVMILMLVRIILKMTHKDPDITPTPPRWQLVLSKAVHGVLYILFISLPFLGVLSLYYGHVEWSFFSYAMPVASAENSIMQHDLKEIHEFIANAGYFIVGLHAAAAIFHHYIMRDNTLVRILPGKH